MSGLRCQGGGRLAAPLSFRSGVVRVHYQRTMNSPLSRIRDSLLLLGLAACSRGEVSSSDVVRTDSAGVRIISSGAVDRELSWTFEEIGPFLDTLGVPWVFENLGPRSVVTDRAGRTYVLTNDPSVVRFGRSGRYELSFGRSGSAPGEMRSPVELLVQGDSLAVLDRLRGVLVRWGPMLEPIADLSFTGALAEANEVAFRSGGIWFVRRTTDGERATFTLIGDTLGAMPALLTVEQPRVTILRGCGTIAIGLPPFFSPEITWAASRGMLLANVGPTYDLRLYEGPRLIASVRRPLRPRPTDRDDLARLHPEGMKFNVGPTQCTFTLDQLVSGPGVAAEYPFVHGLALLSDGTIWVKRNAQSLTPHALDVFNSDGAYAGTVRGMRLPIALLPNGELLVPRDDPGTGGDLIVRMRMRR